MKKNELSEPDGSLSHSKKRQNYRKEQIDDRKEELADGLRSESRLGKSDKVKDYCQAIFCILAILSRL